MNRGEHDDPGREPPEGGTREPRDADSAESEAAGDGPVGDATPVSAVAPGLDALWPPDGPAAATESAFAPESGEVDPSPGPPPPRRTEPSLPAGEAKAPPPMVDPITQPRPGASTWYRSDEDRAKSVYRRANPWYRRAARGIIGLGFLGAAAVGLYFGARAVQDYLERDRLPAAGAEVPEIRATSFLISSAAPAPSVDGTLTMDASTRAFEFVGRATGPQAGLQIVSPDGGVTYVRQGTAPWRVAGDADAAASAVLTAVRYLADDDTADDILTSRLRRGFVDLVQQADEGEGNEQLTRYEMTLDTQAFATDFPLQWQSFQRDAIPGATPNRSVPVTIWLDGDDVLVRVRDEQTNWAWERLTYSEQVFRPVDPTDESQSVVQVACVSDDNQVFWQTPFASCAEAIAIARELAITAGVTDTFGDPAADRTIAVLCSTMERETGPLPATIEDAALAAALVDADVCRGDPTIFTTG